MRSIGISLHASLILGLLLLTAQGCSSRRPAMATELPPSLPVPQVGVIRFVDQEVIAVQFPGSHEPALASRTEDTQVACAGKAVEWSALQEGQAVRIRSVQGVFDAPKAALVEILSGPTAEAVRREVLGPPPTPDGSCPSEAESS